MPYTIVACCETYSSSFLEYTQISRIPPANCTQLLILTTLTYNSDWK